MITGWASWVDEELFNGDLAQCLEQTSILNSVTITRNLEGFRDTKGLRHLVRHWSPSLHTFFFSVGKLTITLEDVVNNFLLPVFGDESPFDIQLSTKDLTVESDFSNTLVGLLLLPEVSQPGWENGRQPFPRKKTSLFSKLGS